MNAAARLKQELWKRFGSPAHPSEWDGRIYGGGRLSQRYWEYHKALELLDLGPDSVVLDIGGGSPETGAGFFAGVLSTVVRRVVVIDPNLKDRTGTCPANVELVAGPAGHGELQSLFASHPEITHVCSISVFEHIEPDIRKGMIRAVDESFRGDVFVATFEYHARSSFFEHQLTARTTSDLFAPMNHFYPDEIVASPVWSEDAFDNRQYVSLTPRRKTRHQKGQIPCWYPVAVRFLRAQG